MENKAKLFAVYLGGSAPRSNIELHDVVFVVGHSLKETYPKLKEKWLGYPEKIPHIDSYIELSYVDGFQVSLTPSSLNSINEEEIYKLYFVNFGAYGENLFGEIHQSAFYVAKNKPEAIQKARKELCVGMFQSHLDNHLDVEELVDFDVDDVLEVENVDGYCLKLTHSDVKTTSLACAGYVLI